MSTPGLLDFIARTPPELYYLLLTPDKTIYGVFLSEDVMEYFINEFLPLTLEIISTTVLLKAAHAAGCKAWGNPDLLQA